MKDIQRETHTHIETHGHIDTQTQTTGNPRSAKPALAGKKGNNLNVFYGKELLKQ